MFSLTLSLSSSSSSLFSTTKLPHHHHKHPTTTTTTTTITSNYPNSPLSNAPQPLGLIIPKSPSSTAVPGNFYQPYRPPPSPLPSKFQNLDLQSMVDILANRQGQWFEYAPLISSLFREGFTPPIIEELTGISGVEQNCLIVAAQVRESIAELNQVSPHCLAYFDNGGSEILYELRLLSAEQRSASAEYIFERKLFDGNKAKEIAKAIKDLPRRQNEVGFKCFDCSKPGDCWAFWHFRLSREFGDGSDKRSSALALAFDVAETEKAKERIKEEMEGKGGVDKGREEENVVVPVVRLRMGEVAEATTVVVLPVVEAKEGERGVGEVPLVCKSEGEFGVVVAEKGWERWVVLPRWVPIAGIGTGGVAVAFSDAKVLPWRVNRQYVEEPILVVADRGRRGVEVEEGFYLVAGGGGGGGGGVEGGFRVEKGWRLKELGVSESLGMVVVVVRPPRDEMDDQISDEEWD